MEKRVAIIFCLLIFTNLCFSQNWDIETIKQTNINRNKKLDPFFTTITNSITYTTVGAPIVTYFVGAYKKDSSIQHKAIIGLQAFVLNGVCTYLLKHAINRPRPVVTYPFVTPLSSETKYSFPSGHTSTAFNTATFLSLNFKKWYIVTPAFIYAGLVGYSRMHIGVHYPTDVIAGAFLGASTAWLTQKINKKLQGKAKYKTLINKFIL